ncbi:hypothetical protein KR009_009876, partial [Drosophila setifemur]
LLREQLLVHCLSALPAPASDDQNSQSWSADQACQDETNGSILKNENDSTCTTFILCYKVNGSIQALNKNCKAGQYFDAALFFCSSNKPSNCD